MIHGHSSGSQSLPSSDFSDRERDIMRIAKRSHGSISGSAIASYLGVFLLVVTLVAVAYHPPVKQQVRADATSTSAPTQASTQTSAASVDQTMATTLAYSLAESTDMPISNNVANLSQSLAVESALAQTDTNVISKPQIIQPTASGRTTQQYTTVAGDSVQTVAAKFGISADTVRWANNLTSDALEAGRTLTILPVDGVTYTVKDGDTIDSIASKYSANREGIVTYNDLDLTGAAATGAQLIIPGGSLPATERPGYVAPSTNAGLSFSRYAGGYGSAYSGGISAGNKYAWGNGTWYAYERRVQLGRPVGSFWGNASTWAYAASSAGLRVDGSPEAGAIMQNGGGYGHVAIVESVNPGVSVSISEMNGYRFGGGFNRVGRGEISWGEATSGMYKYIH